MRLTTLISAGVFIVASAFVMKEKNNVPINAAPVESHSLYKTKWSLKKIHSDKGKEIVSTKAFLKFDEVKKSAGGNGSCNSFGSSTSINENEISFKNIFSTKMYCEEVQQTENAFLIQLGKVNRFEIKDKKLLLYDKDKLLLEFEVE